MKTYTITYITKGGNTNTLHIGARSEKDALEVFRGCWGGHLHIVNIAA